MGLRSSIFDGIVVHSRLIPKKHNFKYKVFSILFNIDDLNKISNKNLLFSYNKFNLFSFFDKDHGEKDGSNPRSWILKIAKETAAWTKLPRTVLEIQEKCQEIDEAMSALMKKF